MAPPLGVTPLEFRRDRLLHKTRVPMLSYGVVCWYFVLPFWYSAGLWQTDRQTHDDSKYRASVASQGQKSHLEKLATMWMTMKVIHYFLLVVCNVCISQEFGNTTVQYVMYFRFCGWRHVFTHTAAQRQWPSTSDLSPPAWAISTRPQLATNDLIRWQGGWRYYGAGAKPATCDASFSVATFADCCGLSGLSTECFRYVAAWWSSRMRTNKLWILLISSHLATPIKIQNQLWHPNIQYQKRCELF